MAEFGKRRFPGSRRTEIATSRPIPPSEKERRRSAKEKVLVQTVSIIANSSEPLVIDEITTAAKEQQIPIASSTLERYLRQDIVGRKIDLDDPCSVTIVRTESKYGIIYHRSDTSVKAIEDKITELHKSKENNKSPELSVDQLRELILEYLKSEACNHKLKEWNSVAGVRDFISYEGLSPQLTHKGLIKIVDKSFLEAHFDKRTKERQPEYRFPKSGS